MEIRHLFVGFYHYIVKFFLQTAVQSIEFLNERPLADCTSGGGDERHWLTPRAHTTLNYINEVQHITSTVRIGCASELVSATQGSVKTIFRAPSSR